MSVVAIGMEMPSCCSECELNYDSLGCSAIRIGGSFDRPGFDMDTERFPNCPLRPLPEKHGDLVDRRAMMDEAKRISGPITGDGWDNWGVYALIDRQPTIVEAEGD